MKQYTEFSNNVKIVIGDQNLAWSTARLHRLGGNNVFIVSDKTLQSLGHIDALRKEIENSEDVKVGKIYLIEDNSPTTLDIDRLYKAFRKSSCDALIAFGGSRVLNATKSLALLLSTNGRSIADYVGIDCVAKQKNFPFGIVSTTFGSGKEVSRTAVVIDEKRKIPLEIVSDALLPDFCVLRSNYLSTLPRKEIYLSLIDVLVYDIEAYISLRTNVLAKSFVKTSMFMIRDNLQKALKTQINEYIYNLQRAAALAGIAYSNTYIGLIHAISNALVAKYKMQHCVALCSVLAASLRFLKDTCKKEYGEMLLFSLGAKEYATLDEDARQDAFINIFDNLTKYIAAEFDININLSSYNITEEDIEEIADIASKDGALITCPKNTTKEDIIDILKQSL